MVHFCVTLRDIPCTYEITFAYHCGFKATMNWLGNDSARMSRGKNLATVYRSLLFAQGCCVLDTHEPSSKRSITFC